MRRKFSAVREHCPPEKLLAIRYSPLATHRSLFASRHSLPFLLGRSLALPFCPPTEVGGYENEAC
jgi:hypothetical protein